MDRLEIGELTVVPLNSDFRLENFDCGDRDLNEFLRHDALAYDEKMLAKTYVAVFRGEVAGFFSICADAIRLSKAERLEEFGIAKPHPDYPALKIARLAVSIHKRGQGIGRFMATYAIGKAIEISRQAGCRYVTVDAYPEQATFYGQKCGFISNQGDLGGKNISMRYDLIDAFRK